MTLDIKEAYYEAMSEGKYDRKPTLIAKYDNVRLFWEDDIMRNFLRPYLYPLIAEKQPQLERLRILDMGCGSGDGYDLLMNIKGRDPGVFEHRVQLIPQDILGHYCGFDNNPQLIEDARRTHSDSEKLSFEIRDFSDGLPLKEGEAPYDIYFTSFGTFSHLNSKQVVKLLSDIAKHCDNYALLICDWLGKYSYEWQSLWQEKDNESQFIDYMISYLYPPDRRHRRRPDSFPLRLVSRREIQQDVEAAQKASGVKMEIKEMFDHSIFVGRHMDTGEYNPHCQPIRRIINAVHADDIRTDLEHLVINYHPKAGFDFLNQFFGRLQMAWNTLVRYTIALLASYDMDTDEFREEPEIPAHYPEVLRNSMMMMRRVIKGTAWLKTGDPRANIIEPQLGFALRALELGMQEGIGTGHGIVAILEIRK